MGYDDLTPRHYVLRFEPDLERSSFGGIAHIHADCKQPTDVIEMDCADMRITACCVFLSSDDVNVAAATDAAAIDDSPALQDDLAYRGNTVNYIHQSATHLIQIPLSCISVDGKQERLVIRLPFKICKTVTIRLDFEGALNDRLLGFYRSSYQDGSNKTKHLATTQFEAADARRAFPCWDEPGAKATFQIQIAVRDQTHDAISNMPVVKIQKSGKTRLFCFDVTPLMSTYLVYMGVGEFAYAQTTYRCKARAVQIRVITTTAVKKRVTKFALEYAARLLGLYESYFGIPYPLPKLDLIAIPDFAAGAMENWGAMTFRENLLLYDPSASSSRTRQLIAEVISHELAHQWFGNLVTMKWWNDLWLNESFATFMATKALDQMHPEWELWRQFLTDAMKTGMELDSLHSTHPIDVPVKSPAQIREIFDPISYDKGGCVLRMLEQYVGEKTFQRGLVVYLKKYRYANARGQDLWRCIQSASGGKPVLKMMASWLDTSGFPVIHLKMQKKKQRIVLSARQTRYVLDGTPLINASQSPALSSRWMIPFSIKPIRMKKQTVLFSTRSTLIDVAPVLASKKQPVVIANPGRTGFYRVKYEQSMLLDILADRGKSLDAYDLWALQNDLFAMCMAGESDMGDYLKMLDAYCDVTDYSIIHDIALNMSRLYALSFGDSSADVMSRHIYDFHRRVYDDITGWHAKKSEPHTTSLLRGPVISWLGRLGDAAIIEKCRRFYEQLHANNGDAKPGAPPPDVIEPVCTVVAWNCKSKSAALGVYKNLVAMYMHADTTEKKMRFATAMCGFSYSDVLLRTLRFALSKNVRSQDFFILVSRVAENPCASEILWPWVQKNWKRISNKAGCGNPLLGRIVSSLANTCSLSDVPGIRQFFEANPAPGTERTLLQTLERIRIADAVRQRMKKEFSAVESNAAAAAASYVKTLRKTPSQNGYGLINDSYSAGNRANNSDHKK